jgi:hypothetical protein
LSRQHLQRNLLLFCCLWSNSLFFSSSSNFSRPRHGSIWFFLFCTLFNRQFCLNCPFWYMLLQKKKVGWAEVLARELMLKRKKKEWKTNKRNKKKRRHMLKDGICFFFLKIIFFFLNYFFFFFEFNFVKRKKLKRKKRKNENTLKNSLWCICHEGVRV